MLNYLCKGFIFRSVTKLKPRNFDLKTEYDVKKIASCFFEVQNESEE